MRSRLRASAVHLLASASLGLLALGLIFLVWYPKPLDEAVGVREVVVLLLAADVVIGPLLTFAVYRVGKKSLKFDLAVIVGLQLAAFTYGMNAIAMGRPVWLVFNADRFDVVSAKDLDDRYERKPEFLVDPWWGPRWVAAAVPVDAAKRNELVWESAMGGADLPQRPDLYVQLNAVPDAFRARTHPLSELAAFNSQQALDRVRAAWPNANGWLPLMNRIKPMVVLVDKDKVEPIAVVDLQPWRE